MGSSAVKILRENFAVDEEKGRIFITPVLLLSCAYLPLAVGGRKFAFLLFFVRHFDTLSLSNC